MLGLLIHVATRCQLLGLGHFDDERLLDDVDIALLCADMCVDMHLDMHMDMYV